MKKKNIGNRLLGVTLSSVLILPTMIPANPVLAATKKMPESEKQTEGEGKTKTEDDQGIEVPDDAFGETSDVLLTSGTLIAGDLGKKPIVRSAGFIDKFEDGGKGTAVVLNPGISRDGYYRVSLEYAKGPQKKTGYISLYKNDEKIGKFQTRESSLTDFVLSDDTYLLKLCPEDTLSLRVDFDELDEAVGRFKTLKLERWGGLKEAEEETLIHPQENKDVPTVVDHKGASGQKMVEGFTEGTGAATKKNVGTGTEFDTLIAPADDDYEFALGYMRSGDYEFEVMPSLYVNDEFIQNIDLPATENVDTFYESTPIELGLKEGDVVSVRVREDDNVKAYFSLDYAKMDVQEKERINPEDQIRFESSHIQVLKGDRFHIPLVNAQKAGKIEYSSGNKEIASVDSDGLIEAVDLGDTVITAQYEDQIFTTSITVVEKNEDLKIDKKMFEAEDGTLIDGESGPLKIVSNKNYSNGKYVEEFFSAGTGAAVQFDNPVDHAGDYHIWLDYNKGIQYSGCTISLYVNENRIGKYTFYDTQNNFASTVPSNRLTANIKPGDKVAVRRDEDDNNCLFRMDTINFERISTTPARAVTLKDEEVHVSERKNASLTRAPEISNDAFTWSSSDEKIVRAKNGTLTGVAPGTATITAKSRYFDGVEDSCTVTVSENEALTKIESEEFNATLDRNFPRVINYRMKDSGSMIDGNYYPIETVQVNEKEYKPEVFFEQISPSEVHYDLNVKELNAVVHMSIKAEGNALKLDVTDITEDGSDENRVFTLNIPSLDIVTVGSEEAGGQFAGAIINNNVTKTGDTFIDLGKIKSPDAKSMDYAYAFLSNDKVSAGIASNGLGNDTDASGTAGTSHLIKQTISEGNSFRTGVNSRAWVYRRHDYTKLFQDLPDRYPDEQFTDDAGNEKMVNKTYQSDPEEQKPYLYVSLAEDINGSGNVDWQDGAVGYRTIMSHAFDEEKVKDLVVQRLIMQQANNGNYPYLSMLDETKRVSLNTDNMGQMILDKYHNEGYWGDLEHYDDHLGGYQDFVKMVNEVSNQYNGYVGVHANFYEYFAKLSYFSPELTQMEADGVTPKNKGYKAYGAFLHQCYNIDNKADALSGNRLNRLSTFKQDVPQVGFVYNDVWYNGGWDGRKIGEDYKKAGLGYFVEWPYVNFDEAMWSHWAVESDYGGAENKGINSDIMRFIWNHTRDRWDNITKEDYPGRRANARNLLIGADTTDYEGWPQTGINRYQDTIEKIYEVNFPTKFLQHFEIQEMNKDSNGWAKYIRFNDNVEAQYTGEDPWNREILINGKTMYKDHSYLLPWDDGELGGTTDLVKEPLKFYHWSDNGGDSTWELPVDWSGDLYLYKLTDLGKQEETIVPAVDGKVTLKKIDAKTGYVLYRDRQAMGNADIDYGSGSFVSDPGFSSGDLNGWNLEKGKAEVKKNYNKGDDQKLVIDQYDGQLRNYELIMEDGSETEVNQKITGLIPGERYAVTAMVEIEQGHKRRSTLSVDCGDTTSENYVDESILVNSNNYDSKANTYMLRIRTDFMVPDGTSEAVIRLKTAADDNKEPAIVRWDNIRVYDCTDKTDESYAPKTHADGSKVQGNVIAYQDFEHTKRNPDLVTSKKGLDGQKTEFEADYPLVAGPGELANNGAAREARDFLVTRNEPYTQNGLRGAQWDPNTTDVDDALAGDRTLRIYAAPLGVDYQTIPQTVRFEKGEKYKVSFLYQYRKAREGDFEFVIGEGSIPREKAHDIKVDNIKENVKIAATSPADTQEDRIGTFTYEFTADSDDTWIGINRVKYIDVTEDPDPFQLDNLLIEKVSGEDEPEEPVMDTEYKVSLAQDQTVAVGANARVDVIVGSDKKKTSFNTIDLTINYDNDKLQFVSINDEEHYDAADGDGTLRITGYGADKELGTACSILFKSLAMTDGTQVSIEQAKVDESANAVTEDAPEATMVHDTVTIVVNGYEVKLGEHLNGSSIAEPGKDYTFTADDYEYYDYTLTTTVEEKDISANVIHNDDGSYTIPGELVTGVIEVKSERKAKTYKVTFEGNAVLDVMEAESQAAYGTDYKFVVNQEENFCYQVVIHVGGKELKGYAVEGSSYIIPGSEITGDLVISIEKTPLGANEVNVSFEGTGAGDAKGQPKARKGKDYTFTIKKEAGFTYAISAKCGETEIKIVDQKDDSYTIKGKDVIGDLVILIDKEMDAKVKVSEYVKLDQVSMFLVTLKADKPEDGNCYKYDGNRMYWSKQYQAYTFLVISEDAFTEETAKKAISIGDGKTVTIDYNGDVNETGLVDINDAQLVYDMYNAKFKGFEEIGMVKYLKADMNGDRILNVADSEAAVHQVLS